MNINRVLRIKTAKGLTALILGFVVAGTSVATFTTVVEAGVLKPSEILKGKLRKAISFTKGENGDLKLDELVDYDFSSYEIISVSAQKYTHSFEAVDTFVSLIIYNDDPSIDVDRIMKETESLIKEYENVVSKTKKGSFTYTLNNTGVYDYSDSDYANVIHELANKSRYYAELSKGALDVTIEPVVKLWNVNNGNTEVPKQSNIDTALALVDYNNFVNDEVSQEYMLLNGARVDFGALGKGQLADIVKASLMSKGINSALINLGGNVMTLGAKPGDKNWVIAIQDPRGATSETLGTIEVKNKTVVTSGDYERYFMSEGVRYHHIMDTVKGFPSKSGLAQTTIVSDRSIDCDALSTTTFILGKEKGMELIDGLEGFECLFIDENNNYYTSENFTESYNLVIENKDK